MRYSKAMVFVLVAILAITSMFGMVSCDSVEDVSGEVLDIVLPNVENPPSVETDTTTEVTVPPITDIAPDDSNTENEAPEDIIIDVNQREESNDKIDAPTLEGDAVITPGTKGVN
ncbi:MAG: hypothetical protein J6Q78_02660 [Clostridia bacterium]|nr:hypothetical protein [Clostridia bacterium]